TFAGLGAGLAGLAGAGPPGGTALANSRPRGAPTAPRAPAHKPPLRASPVRTAPPRPLSTPPTPRAARAPPLPARARPPPRPALRRAVLADEQHLPLAAVAEALAPRRPVPGHGVHLLALHFLGHGLQGVVAGEQADQLRRGGLQRRGGGIVGAADHQHRQAE